MQGRAGGIAIPARRVPLLPVGYAGAYICFLT
jgi:hypothetical protein